MAKNEYSVSSQKRLRRLGWIGLGVLGLIVLAMIPGYRLWEYYCGRAVESNAVLTLPTGSDFRAVISGRWLILSSRPLFCITRNVLKCGPLPVIWTCRYIRGGLAWMQV